MRCMIRSAVEIEVPDEEVAKKAMHALTSGFAGSMAKLDDVKRYDFKWVTITDEVSGNVIAERRL